MVSGFTIRNPPQTQNRHHMVDAQGTAVLHVGAQQLNKRLIGTGDDDMRIHRRQTPVLSQRAKNVRRRPDGGFQTIQLAVAPGFRTAFRHAHRQIAVQANRHRVMLAGVPAFGELAIRQPLQPEVETHLVGLLGAERFHFRAVDILIRFWPGRPAPAQRILLYLPGVQGVIRRLPVQAFAFTKHELAELCHRLIVTGGKSLPGHAQRGHFQRGHGGIIHIIGLTRGL